MANSSIGPGFLTQTTVYTRELMASFGFIILAAVILDLGAQLNTWRILTISELRAQDFANKVLPGLGYILSAAVVLGGFAFNIGNIAGCGLALNVLFGWNVETGAILSGVIAIGIFASALTESQIVAFLIAVFLCFIMLSGFSLLASLPGRAYTRRKGGPPCQTPPPRSW